MTEPLGGNLSRLRQLNTLAVVHALRRQSPLTLTEVAKAANLSRPATEEVLRDLEAQGWVAQVDPVAGSMGRPARRYRFRADAGHVLGVDIGGHTVRAIVADLDGELRHSERRSVSVAAGRAERLRVVDKVIAECLAGAGLTGADLWATTVATTGFVDADGRVVLSVGLPEWTGVHLGEHVSGRVSGPVLVENDCRLAALAETWRGVARYAEHVVYLLAGLRTGAGLVIDGRLHRGFARAAGEIGALPEMGWIRAQEHLRGWSGAPAGTDPDEVVALVFAAARDGDRGALAAVRRYVRDLSIGASALVLALDPQLVVLGGGFSRSADVLLEPFHRELEKRCVRTPEVLPSALGDDAVALGAVKHALDHLEQHIFDPGNGLAAPEPPQRP
ncbi:transcriptional regulator [Virgisporangium aliadipatigenens]|uniref:Transcriptional regulator n=1 Tax=Virgisporangium aliadipatigenens TaxID=741659 RepID=A0A8J3YQ13_9ACTN|nr:ROK family transcriptional regulator [Virgisporangium aliadipatigenens]GIJ48228.1 transcriptional regulator [Virgisporangium aliadipatigenens]